MISPNDLRAAIQRLNLVGKPLIVHTSLRSFGEPVRAEDLIAAFFAEGCTILVPAFTWAYQVPPPPNDRPERNALNYDQLPAAWEYQRDSIYTPDVLDIAPDWGTFPRIVIQAPDHVRGNNPIDSFIALGPRAEELVQEQAPLNVYAPLQKVAELGGSVLLIGVDYTKMTLIHAAEK